jgi:hypothetical protein
MGICVPEKSTGYAGNHQLTRNPMEWRESKSGSGKPGIWRDTNLRRSVVLARCLFSGLPHIVSFAWLWSGANVKVRQSRLVQQSSPPRKKLVAYFSPSWSGPVAQVDRALRFERRGWEFKSLRVRQYHREDPYPPALRVRQSLRNQILRCAQDFGCGLPLRSRPQSASSSSLSGSAIRSYQRTGIDVSSDMDIPQHALLLRGFKM